MSLVLGITAGIGAGASAIQKVQQSSTPQNVSSNGKTTIKTTAADNQVKDGFEGGIPTTPANQSLPQKVMKSGDKNAVTDFIKSSGKGDEAVKQFEAFYDKYKSSPYTESARVQKACEDYNKKAAEITPKVPDSSKQEDAAKAMNQAALKNQLGDGFEWGISKSPADQFLPQKVMKSGDKNAVTDFIKSSGKGDEAVKQFEAFYDKYKSSPYTESARVQKACEDYNKWAAKPVLTGKYNRETGELTLTHTNPETSETKEIKGDFKSGNGGKSTETNGPVPKGEYDILWHPRDGFFRLEPVDSNYGDNKYSREDIAKAEGVDLSKDIKDRKNIGLHHPGNTQGCITSKDADQWQTIEAFINDSFKTKVTIDKGGFWNSGTEETIRYGRITVT